MVNRERNQTNNNVTKELYLFSGLGADERVFQRLDFSGCRATFIKWIIPESRETIENYARRLLDQITTTKPVLIGLSFGGLMAVEVAKQIETEKVILIASAKVKNEIPFYYRYAGKLGLHRLLPAAALKRANCMTNWLFGANSVSDKQLLKRILGDTDTVFVKWAINSVVCWRNQFKLRNIIHIHGTNDKILPSRFVSCDISVKSGGHLMTLTRPDELTSILRQQL